MQTNNSSSNTSGAKRQAGFDLRRLVGSVNQLRFSDNRGEVSFFGQKMIILRRDVIRVMREALERVVGDQAAPFLSFLASGVGIHEGSIFRDSVTSTGVQQRNELENLVRSAFEDTNLGLGKIQIRMLDFDRTMATVSVANCFEAMENGMAEDPNCMFTSGFLAGLFAEVFDRTVQAKEVHCISQGQPECLFELSLAEGAENASQPDQLVETTTIEQAPVPPHATSEAPIRENAEPQKPVPVTAPSTASSVRTDATTPNKVTGIASESALSQPSSQSKTPPSGSSTVQQEQTHPSPSPLGSSKSQDEASEIKQSDVDAGVARASRIAQRKQGFWERHLKKNKEKQ